MSPEVGEAGVLDRNERFSVKFTVEDSECQIHMENRTQAFEIPRYAKLDNKL